MTIKAFIDDHIAAVYLGFGVYRSIIRSRRLERQQENRMMKIRGLLSSLDDPAFAGSFRQTVESWQGPMLDYEADKRDDI